MAKTRSFKSGNSVAVRLPKGIAVPPGVEFDIDRNGDVITLRPSKSRFRQMLAALLEMEGPGEVQEREPIEFPERPGL